MSPDAAKSSAPTLLTRVRSIGGFASACIAAVIVAMATLALAIGDFELAF